MSHLALLGERGLRYLTTKVLADPVRLLRFACTGTFAAIVQLILLKFLTNEAWNVIVADGVALVLSAQVNFALSSLFTWRDRSTETRSLGAFLRRWMTFQGSVAGTTTLNIVIFTGASLIIPVMVASVVGTGVASLANFAAMDLLVFAL